MFLQHLSAMNAYRNIMLNQSQVAKSLRRLSSGFRINSAADDPAGLAISERMRGQIRGLRMAVQNTKHTVNMLQTAEGGLQETHSMLQRMRELAVQAANGTYSDQDRSQLAKEFEALKEEINRISSATHYNGIKLLDGSQGTTGGEKAASQLGIREIAVSGLEGSASFALQMREDGSGVLSMVHNGTTYLEAIDPSDTALTLQIGGGSVKLSFSESGPQSGDLSGVLFQDGAADLSNAEGGRSDNAVRAQIGANGGNDQTISTRINDMSAENLGRGTKQGSVQDCNIYTQEAAREAIDVLEGAIQQVSGERAGLGAQINRLGHTLNNLENSIENLTAAESTIRDVDMAEEMMNFTKHSILVQVGQAMLAQAMKGESGILELLKSL